MLMKVLTTNHGKHSDEKLGFAIADDIVDVAAAANAGDSMDARRLANQIGDIAAKHMKVLSDRENAGIEAKGPEHLAEPLVANSETADAMEAEILACCEAFGPATSKWFKGDSEDVARARKNVHDVVHKWVRDAQHMHRDWYARHGMVGEGTDLRPAEGYDPNNEHIKRWKDLHDAPTPDAFRRALHEHATGEKLAS
jgi:hypothetical protein